MAKGIYVGVNINLVENGDFSRGLEGWSLYNDNISDYSVIKEADDNIFKFKGISATSNKWALMQELNLDTSHIYYGTALVRGDAATDALNNNYMCLDPASFGTVSTTSAYTAQTWKRIAVYGTPSKVPWSLKLSFKISNDNYNYVKAIAMYDLTEMFGAGNEPTRVWCDNNLEDLSGGVARKVKKAYVGVSNKARKIKKGYIGVGGIARQFYSSETVLSYYGKATDLAAARQNLAATSVGNYALFAGGNEGTTFYRVVDTYNNSLVKGMASNLSVGRNDMAATSVGNYALFGGGYGGNYKNNVDTYNGSLVKGTATTLSTATRYLAATSVGNYALFAGGYTGGGYTKTVCAYDSSLAMTSPTALSNGRQMLVATTVGGYALFAGGRTKSSTRYSTVDTYNSSLVKGTASNLSVARYGLATTTVGDYALFGGGLTSNGVVVVDTYNSSLVKGTATDLSVARQYLVATSVDNYALFGGGAGPSNISAVVDTYNNSLVKGTASDLSVARYNFVATSVGNYALFGGGYNTDVFATVDVYQAI